MSLSRCQFNKPNKKLKLPSNKIHLKLPSYKIHNSCLNPRAMKCFKDSCKRKLLSKRLLKPKRMLKQLNLQFNNSSKLQPLLSNRQRKLN